MRYDETPELCAWRARGTPEETRRFTDALVTARAPEHVDTETLASLIRGRAGVVPLGDRYERLLHRPGEVLYWMSSFSSLERCRPVMSDVWNRAKHTYVNGTGNTACP